MLLQVFFLNYIKLNTSTFSSLKLSSFLSFILDILNIPYETSVLQTKKFIMDNLFTKSWVYAEPPSGDAYTNSDFMTQNFESWIGDEKNRQTKGGRVGQLNAINQHFVNDYRLGNIKKLSIRPFVIVPSYDPVSCFFLY